MFQNTYKCCTVWAVSHLVLIFSKETILTLFKHGTFIYAHKIPRNPKQNLKTQLGSLLMSHLIENKGNRKRHVWGTQTVGLNPVKGLTQVTQCYLLVFSY